MAGNEAQDTYLRLIGLSGEWNEFNGAAIEASLRSHPELWCAVVFTSQSSGLPQKGGGDLRNVVNLVVLRDLPNGWVTLDTLFVLAAPGRQAELESLASTWRADDVTWVAQDEAFAAMGESPTNNPDYATDTRRVILRAWWD